MTRLAWWLLFFGTAIIAASLLSFFKPDLAKAQQRTIYGADGRVIAREATTPSGQTTLYGADGRVITRSTTDADRARNQGSDTRNDALHKRGGK